MAWVRLLKTSSWFPKGIARNVTATALMCSDLLIKSGSFSEAQKWLICAEEFEKKTEYGPAFTEQIADLKDAARRGLALDGKKR